MVELRSFQTATSNTPAAGAIANLTGGNSGFIAATGRWTAPTSGPGARATLDLTNFGTLNFNTTAATITSSAVFNGAGIAVGTGGTTTNTAYGSLYLANYNNLNINQIQVGDSAGQFLTGLNELRLGSTNLINVHAIRIGDRRSTNAFMDCDRT